MRSLAKNTHFLLKFIPSSYKSLVCHPLETNIRLNVDKAIRRQLLKKLEKPPFNFIYDGFKDQISLVHESAGIVLYVFPNYIVWKENRLADMRVSHNTELEDV